VGIHIPWSVCGSLPSVHPSSCLAESTLCQVRNDCLHWWSPGAKSQACLSQPRSLDVSLKMATYHSETQVEHFSCLKKKSIHPVWS
jgi:hypothetical protein